MKRYITIVSFLILAMVINTNAQKTFGLGFILGEPTGISGKYWMDKTNAIDAAAAWSFRGQSSFLLQADYLHHYYGIFGGKASGNLPLYIGIGGRLRTKGYKKDKEYETALGVRVPFGITYIFPTAPLDAFLEIVPVMDIIPGTQFNIDAAIGMRYYF